MALAKSGCTAWAGPGGWKTRLRPQSGERDASSNRLLHGPGFVPPHPPPSPARRPSRRRGPGPPCACATPRPCRTRATSLRPPHPRHDERHPLSSVVTPHAIGGRRNVRCVGAGLLASAAGRVVAWVAVRRRGLEGQYAGVDAITPAGGTGAVAEDMAQMTAAAA